MNNEISDLIHTNQSSNTTTKHHPDSVTIKNTQITQSSNQVHKATQTLVALYCGSRPGNNPIYKEKAIQLAKGIAHRGFGIVYGGASIGLMGQVADTVIQTGGEVVGVIPEFMLDYEIAHSTLTELHVVETMHQRKAMMADRASAFVALPGGLGTFEEILEIATWGQLNQHQKPMIIYNVNGFYNALIAQLDHAVAEGFLPPQHRAKLIICDQADQIYSVIHNLKHPKNMVV
ncbi:TIGR00730 family Rossman fold protein [Acinetobacter sp. 194]|uniref:LOG family protein n=1 Tax=Acinetobacter shaoyimingii TaxID=2715164 RepID=UPI00140D9C77|nr:TIGR00730 family Rossman fold protein [Acinetobacter shaoyimingii]NHB59226.1 TIGR00730 family Rossman fold protein [Acinetobacter shaoyimingii]